MKSPEDPVPPKVEKLATEVSQLNMIEARFFFELLSRKLGVDPSTIGSAPAAGEITDGYQITLVLTFELMIISTITRCSSRSCRCRQGGTKGREEGGEDRFHR